MLSRILFVLISFCYASASVHGNTFQQQKILSIEANCTRDLMHVKINMLSPFKGMIFAKGFSEECASVSGSPSLTLPLSSCGIRSRFLSKDTVEYSVRLVAQMDSKLQQQSDILAIAKCSLASEVMDVNVDGMKKHQKTGRMRSFRPSSKIRSWLEIGSSKGQDFVLVGENSTLSIRSILARNVGMRIIDCVAFDGVGESSQRLFDEFGCPSDPEIMSHFTENIIDIEDGWSKNNEDDIVQKVFSTNFQAFIFPDREIIHIKCGIHLCKGKCPNVPCDGSLIREKMAKPLARIEVFNSLKVLAPQIEIDRPVEKNESNENPSAWSSHLGYDVLCVSQSKLAIAFCTLGLIFLMAVVVAIFCSLRYLSLSRNTYRSMSSSNDHHSGRRSIFSVSSGSIPSQSSLDIDSKLFAPGRVY